MKSLAACRGQWCPAREVCERHRRFEDLAKRGHSDRGAVYVSVLRDRQRRGMQCGEWLPMTTTNKEQEIER